ncbi:metallophosphoesterase [Porphyromonas somerae]|uniref:Ser/Thr phosphatase family protein n=1 Tax=Porphyromonas somerae TaxID=322095 RepID=A0A134B682_9PORP|nr:metallophosphoesterase [Porphyromonas somerae]KXB74018.1 Ser/Thr phosphatase family protein [Porphyromonadaceae bacterium KA00676]KXB75446.1 Ser/Thr phosphatase family protein [Porphyromonas somerae]
MVYLYSVLCCLFLFPYLGWRAGQVLGPRLRRAFWGLLVLIFVFFSIALLIHRRFEADWMSAVMNGSVYIFFSTMYATAVVVGVNVLRYIDARTLKLYASARPAVKQGVKVVAFIATLAVFFTTMVIGHRNVRYPRVMYQKYTVKRLVPEGAQPEKRIRLVFFSDLHIGEAMTPDYIARAVKLIQDQQPDLILCGGDFIDHRAVYAYDPRVMASLRSLHAPMGVYYVLGNHEYRDDLEANIRWVSEVGGTLLRDSIAFPGNGPLTLIGRDDWVNGNRKPFEVIANEADPLRGPVVLMEHTPASIDSIGDSPVDLILCGHTHGGQIWPGQLMVWWRYGMVSGTRPVGEREVCISSGIGSAGATYRVGTRSEIRVYDLYW